MNLLGGRTAPWQITRVRFTFSQGVAVDVNDLKIVNAAGASIAFSAPIAAIEFTVTGPGGAPAPGRLELIQSASTSAVYGARLVADGDWASGAYTATLHATTLEGESIDYSWAWTGGGYALQLPILEH